MKKTKLLVIRGARIVQQMERLTEDTYAKLERDTLKFTPVTTKREHAVDPTRVTELEIIPARESQIITARATVQSEGTKYTTTMVFDGVQYQEDDQATNVSFKGVGGEEQHIERINLDRSNCKVSCNCLDFYWRFATQNAKANSLDGKAPPPYHKRSTRPPANLQNTPGICKHLMKTVIALKEAGLVR